MLDKAVELGKGQSIVVPDDKTRKLTVGSLNLIRRGGLRKHWDVVRAG